MKLRHRIATAALAAALATGLATALPADAHSPCTGTCNTFLYRFRHVAVAYAPGGGWHQVTGGYPIRSASTRIQRARGSAGFLAAEGRPAFQFLSATS